jgi:hypothetical protein
MKQFGVTSAVHGGGKRRSGIAFLTYLQVTLKAMGKLFIAAILMLLR